MYNVNDYGALGVAKPLERLKLANTRFKWVEYPEGFQADVYGAFGNAEYDSVGIQRAIDAAHRGGGGTVVVPAGDYLFAPIELRSHVCLRLEPGARLWGSPRLEDYFDARGEKMPYIGARGVKNAGITGPGTISGQSPAFIIPWMNNGPQRIGELARPGKGIHFLECEDVFLEGVQVRDTPNWGIVIERSRQVRLDGVRLRSMDVINGDGIDLVNSSEVTISNCDLYCTDDAIVLKNFDEGQTMRNITVTNCVIRTLCNGFKIGTESIGNFDNITVANLSMYGDSGLAGDRGGINLCAVDGGSVRNINISNIVMRDMFCAFYLYASNRDCKRRHFNLEPRKTGLMERIHISNIVADGIRYPSYIVGHPDLPIRDLVLSNIDLRKTRDFYAQPPISPVPELPDEYPTPFAFGSRDRGDQLPACGLYLRHVDRIRVRDFVQCNEKPDARKLLVQENCTGVEVTGLSLRNPSEPS